MAALVGAAVALATGGVAVAIALVCVTLVLAALALHHATLRGRVPTGPPALERVAHAVADAYAALGEIAPASAASVVFAPRLGGRIRVALAQGSAEENRRFATALEEALGSATAHRYLVSRPLPRAASNAAMRAARAVIGKEQPELPWHPVPSDLGRNRARADAYHHAWQRHVAPEGTLAYTGTSEEGRALLTQATGEPAAYTASHRTLWV